ncbi:hypothetical protein TrVE_jg6850 [Triparma verrucosa]|uniref:3-oxo-5-alpha-steroid 4-dehydrogenase C-terminal domain-containing protein n=1 Tax=Triparma verrucosa TaxID=1606542 RepID=A0A9W7BJ35_9STRA|nr:hypothetical protein TrVE_jg6850 [Triparma verrucosa]
MFFAFPQTPLDRVDLSVAVLLGACVVLMGFGNALNIPLLGRSQGFMTYSKFAQEKAGRMIPSMELPSRLGMFLLYFPPALLAFSSLRPQAYTAFAWMNIYYADKISPPLSDDPLTASEDVFLSVGLALFFIGQGGNLYHHWCLRCLRKLGEVGYKVPTGGLFEFVAAPHYLFELISWLGVAFCTRHIYALVLFVGMCAYLFERASAQDEWNRKKLKDKYLAHRKRILPFIW